MKTSIYGKIIVGGRLLKNNLNVLYNSKLTFLYNLINKIY